MDTCVNLFFRLAIFLPVCLFFIRSFIFSRFFSSFKDRIFCFIPIFSTYFFSDKLVDKKQTHTKSRFVILLCNIFYFLAYSLFVLFLIFTKSQRLFYGYIDSFSDSSCSEFFFINVYIVYCIFRVSKFFFNLAYLGVLKTIFWNTGSKNKVISFLITFSTLFFSEILSLYLVYRSYLEDKRKF